MRPKHAENWPLWQLPMNKREMSDSIGQSQWHPISELELMKLSLFPRFAKAARQVRA